MSKVYFPKQLFIEDSVKDSALTKNVLRNLPHLKPEYFTADVESHFSHLSLKNGKDILVIARKKGRFLKSCPGTKESLCCGYFILESSSNCNYDCTYCILQTYLNSPPLIVYANLDDMFEELNGIFSTEPKVQFRIGTGELSDSLSLDHITEFSKIIVPFFSKLKKACLEFKTKSAQIGNLSGLNHQKRSVVSWSLGTRRMARLEELKAPDIEERLSAAAQVQAWGYPVGFHLEPLLYYPEWEKDYRELIHMIFDYVDPKNIVWISLGGLRLIDGLKDFTEDRFPKSSFHYEELIPGSDGKLKYLKLVRLELYRKISSWIREKAGPVPMYLCMEPAELWKKGLGFSFNDADEADEFLGEKVFEREKKHV